MSNQSQLPVYDDLPLDDFGALVACIARAPSFSLDMIRLVRWSWQTANRDFRAIHLDIFEAEFEALQAPPSWLTLEFFTVYKMAIFSLNGLGLEFTGSFDEFLPFTYPLPEFCNYLYS